MKSIERPAATRIWIVAAALASIPVVGYLDGLTSAYIAFSIFYVVPIILCAWFGTRSVAVAAAGLAILSGLAADVWSIGARPVYTFVNLGSRVTLFFILALAFSQLRRAVEDQRELARSQHLLAAQQEELSELRRRLMEEVLEATRGPLGEIYAKVVDFSFDNQTLSPENARDLMRELAQASKEVSRLIETLDGKHEPVGAGGLRDSA